MSNRSVSTHAGAPTVWKSRSPYAKRMIDPSVTLYASKAPPGTNLNVAPPHTPRITGPAEVGFTDATSNDGSGTDCARRGATTNAVPTLARTAFCATRRFTAVRFVMMSLIRFFTFEPLTPDTHASGDST